MHAWVDTLLLQQLTWEPQQESLVDGVPGVGVVEGEELSHSGQRRLFAPGQLQHRLPGRRARRANHSNACSALHKLTRNDLIIVG